MPLERKDNQKRMEKNRAADKKENKREERDAIINGVVAKLSDKLPDMLRTMVSAEVQFNQMSGQRKLSCRDGLWPLNVSQSVSQFFRCAMTWHSGSARFSFR